MKSYPDPTAQQRWEYIHGRAIGRWWRYTCRDCDWWRHDAYLAFRLHTDEEWEQFWGEPIYGPYDERRGHPPSDRNQFELGLLRLLYEEHCKATGHGWHYQDGQLAGPWPQYGHVPRYRP